MVKSTSKVVARTIALNSLFTISTISMISTTFLTKVVPIFTLAV